jgi:hypothetical protein
MAENHTEVAFGQGNSSFARSFPTRNYSAGIVEDSYLGSLFS